MKINQGIANEISRWFLFVLLFVVLGGGFLSFGLWMLLEGELIGLLIILYAFFLDISNGCGFLFSGFRFVVGSRYICSRVPENKALFLG